MCRTGAAGLQKKFEIGLYLLVFGFDITNCLLFFSQAVFFSPSIF